MKNQPSTQTFLANPIIAALDVDSSEECFSLAKSLRPHVGAFKVGPRLMVRYGSGLSAELAKLAPVFIDNKYLDIPSTMEAAIRASFEAGASLATVHAWAGLDALKLLAQTEKELNQKRPFKVLAVTILTSFSQATLPPPQSAHSIEQRVDDLAAMVIESGLSGLVCSPHEVASLRQKFPEAFLVTPGVRLAGGDKGDQVRVMTPAEAMVAGASALVIGRPLYGAKNPEQVARDVAEQVKNFNTQKA